MNRNAPEGTLLEEQGERVEGDTVAATSGTPARGPSAALIPGVQAWGAPTYTQAERIRHQGILIIRDFPLSPGLSTMSRRKAEQLTGLGRNRALAPLPQGTSITSLMTGDQRDS
jgi:hypothetical protein